MSRIFGKVEFTKVKSIHIGTKCDYCKIEQTPTPESWMSYLHSHSGWGSDSEESIERFDACSPECFIELLKRESIPFLSQYADDDAEVAGMPIEFAEKLVHLIESKQD